MICDKCGFEHNNRSACPKCGARVIYVNEDYLKRRQEWEEAQKQGRKDALPPGIMHSTAEEHKAAKGRADKEPQPSKGGPETVSLSFRVKKFSKIIAILFKLLWVRIVALKDRAVNAYKRRFVKRRGADNPIIRELKFDDSPDTLDESKLVVSHKVYKDKRKYIFIGAGALLVIVIGIIVAVNIVKNIDRSNVLYFDGRYAYMAAEPDEPLFGNINGNITMVYGENECWLGYDTEKIYIYSDGKTGTIEVSCPEIITYSLGLDTVIFKENGLTKIYSDGEIHILEIETDAVYTKSSSVSDSGKYFAFTICENAADENMYSLYLGDSAGGLTLIQKSDKEIEIISLSDSGEMIYTEMSTAKYGIVNERNIMYYNGEVKCLAENADRYMYAPDGKIYYTDDNNKLYKVSPASGREFVDEDVTEFVDNILASDEVLYQKDGKCYGINENGPYKICTLPSNGCSLIYNDKMTIKYCYDHSYLYVLDGLDKTEKYSLMYDGSFVFFEVDCMMYVLDSDGILIRITEDKKITTETVNENVARITQVEGQEGIAFLQNSEVYIRENDSHKSFKIYDSSVLNKVIYSKKCYYMSDKDNILWKISSDGKEKTSLGNIENYIFIN